MFGPYLPNGFDYNGPTKPEGDLEMNPAEGVGVSIVVNKKTHTVEIPPGKETEDSVVIWVMAKQ